MIGQIITWPVSTQRMYDLEHSGVAGMAFWQGMPGMSNIHPAPPTFTITNTFPEEAVEMIRIRVKLPKAP